jgi:hypothetical protein
MLKMPQLVYACFGTLMSALIGFINRLLAEVREQGTGNREQWEELEFLGIKLI